MSLNSYSYIRCQLLHLLISVLSFVVGTQGYALYDLGAVHQDFILETKQIHIPNFPDAFNPSMVRWNGSILMCFRIRDPLTSLTNQIGIIWLDSDFNLASEPHILQLHTHENVYFPRTQDPRLINVGSDLYIAFNEFHNTSLEPNRRMAFAKLFEENDFFYAEPPNFLLNFEHENPAKQEKNWAPFVHNGQLLFSYSIEPHLVLHPTNGTNFCNTLFNTSSNIKWNWGILRGGSPAEKIGDQYLAFFHSVKDLISLQSEGSRILHYFMGAYTFNSSPPFNLTKISPEPIIAQNFYNGPQHNTWKPLLVVFPGGYVYDDNYIWLAYGRQDHETWIVKMDRKGLLNSLLQVSEPK